MAFANLGNGFLADIFDPAWLLTVGGLAFLVVTAVSMVGPCYAPGLSGKSTSPGSGCMNAGQIGLVSRTRVSPSPTVSPLALLSGPLRYSKRRVTPGS